MRASIEVLTDGSELTEPALFLTIRRCNDSTITKQNINKNNQIDTEVDVNCIYYEQHNSSKQSTDNDIDEGTIVSRYNLTGHQESRIPHTGPCHTILICFER